MNTLNETVNVLDVIFTLTIVVGFTALFVIWTPVYTRFQFSMSFLFFGLAAISWRVLYADGVHAEVFPPLPPLIRSELWALVYLLVIVSLPFAVFESWKLRQGDDEPQVSDHLQSESSGDGSSDTGDTS